MYESYKLISASVPHKIYCTRTTLCTPAKFQVIPKFEILMKSHHMNPSLTISSI